MPVLNPKDISEVMHGDREIGALFAGDKLMYNKRHLVEYLNAGTYKFLVPRWANYVSVITKGGGGGGSAGSYYTEKGGEGGGISTKRILFRDSNIRYAINLTVGAGGRGGQSTGSKGQDGEASSWRYNEDISDRAGGGAGGASSTQNGGEGYGYNKLSAAQAAHLLREEGSRYFPSVAGTGNGGHGRYGGGGAGGKGDLRAGWGKGGNGGDGFVSICCWGVDPTLPRLGVA